MMDKANISTATNGINEPVSLERLQAAMREICLLPKNDQWIVIDPQGRMYQGTVQQVMPLLVNAHPYFNRPLDFNCDV